MDLYVYSDESGVFDCKHNKYFVFGGLIFLGKEERDVASRMFKAAENRLRINGTHCIGEELKACRIIPKEKNKLFRALNRFVKFGVVINQARINDRVFENKKSKQRYLDYAYKIALKRALESLINSNMIKQSEVSDIFVFVDEHTTATNGRYELREALEQELKVGTFNYNYDIFFPPIFPQLKGVNLHLCDSSKKVLIRAADITANSIYYNVNKGNFNIYEKDNLFLINLP